MVAVLSWRIRALSDSVVLLVQSPSPLNIVSMGRYGLLEYLKMRGLGEADVMNPDGPRCTMFDGEDFWLLPQVNVLHPEVWRCPLARRR